MLKRFVLMLGGLFAMIALVSCGEESVGGGVGEFTTVSARAQSSTSRLESDVVDNNTCTDGVSDGGTVITESVNVNFISTSMYASGALNLVISSITVQYVPRTVNGVTAPPLATRQFSHQQTVGPGQSVTVPVAVVTDGMKMELINRATQNLDLCSGEIFEYDVTILFEVSEPGGNGDVHNIPARLTVAIADRV